MKKLKNLAALCALMALSGAALAQERVAAVDGGPRVDNWTNGTGDLVWKNGSNELCWRNSNWTPATAAVGCDGALLAQAPATAPIAPIVPIAAEPQPQPPTAAAPQATPLAASKVSYAADTFFDFDKSVIKPAGKAQLDDLVGKLSDISLEVAIVVGHTDSVGSDAYNQKLSMRRAEAVKAYLVSKGLASTRVMVEGRGETKPVASNADADGRARNRRVEIEVVGTRP